MDIDVYAGLEPAEVWRHFAGLNAAPRPSGKEELAREYVKQACLEAGASCHQDAFGNVVVSVAASSPELSTSPTVAVQAHLDMVCQKRPDVAHNFKTDPIRPRRVGDLIYATGTTLGADNGIGAAMALALATTPGLVHGPLELIFTVEEETGLHGAMALDERLVRSRLLINLDSEDPEELTVGCAGGAGTILRLENAVEHPEPGQFPVTISISGLKGGHSGVQIHEPLANAIKLLAFILQRLRSASIPFRIATIEGGTAHNAIPRDAQATIVVAREAFVPITDIGTEAYNALRQEWGVAEPSLKMDLCDGEMPAQMLPSSATEKLIDLIIALPHGVQKMSESFPGKVETSSNLAEIRTAGDTIEIATSSRSFVEGELQGVQDFIAQLGAEVDAAIEVRDGYRGWEPNPQSRLLQVTRKAYEEVYRHAPAVEVVHAGLECGVLVSRLEGMDAISFGPLIKGAHSPDEYVDASTVEASWKLLTLLLQRISEESS